MPNDRRPPLRTRLRYQWDRFNGWLNRRSKRVQILVGFAALLAVLTAAEVFSQEVLGLDPYPSNDRNEEPKTKMPESVKELQANWITTGQLKRLHPGMTVDEVTTIVGSKGFVHGADGAGSETRQWFGPGIRHSELVFQAGVLVSITQTDTPGLPASGR